MIERSFDAAAKGVPFIDGHASGWNLFGDHTTLPAAVILGDVLAEQQRDHGGLLPPQRRAARPAREDDDVARVVRAPDP